MSISIGQRPDEKRQRKRREREPGPSIVEPRKADRIRGQDSDDHEEQSRQRSIGDAVVGRSGQRYSRNERLHAHQREDRGPPTEHQQLESL